MQTQGNKSYGWRWCPSPENQDVTRRRLLLVAIDRGEDGEHDGSGDRQGLAVGKPERRGITTECSDIAGGHHGHSDGHGWYQKIDQQVRKLSGMTVSGIQKVTCQKTVKNN